MFNNLYVFFYNWLFADGLGALSTNGAEFICIVFCFVTLFCVLFIALIPIRYFIDIIFGR